MCSSDLKPVQKTVDDDGKPLDEEGTKNAEEKFAAEETQYKKDYAEYEKQVAANEEKKKEEVKRKAATSKAQGTQASKRSRVTSTGPILPSCLQKVSNTGGGACGPKAYCQGLDDHTGRKNQPQAFRVTVATHMHRHGTDYIPWWDEQAPQEIEAPCVDENGTLLESVYYETARTHSMVWGTRMACYH